MRILVALLMIVSCLDWIFAEDRLAFNDDEPPTHENRAIEHRDSRIQISNETTDTFFIVHARAENRTRSRRHAVKARRALRLPRPSNKRHRFRNKLKLRNSNGADDFVETSRHIRLPQRRRKIKAATDENEEYDRDEDRDQELKKSIEWDDWGNWTKCSVTCGTGRRIRWRHCTDDSCPMKGLKRAQMKPCHRKKCPKGLLSWIGIKS